MAKDPGALSALRVSRPYGTYKITDGLAPAVRRSKLVPDLQKFLRNLDECSSNANTRIFLTSEWANKHEKDLRKMYVRDTAFHLATDNLYMGNKTRQVFSSLEKGRHSV